MASNAYARFVDDLVIGVFRYAEDVRLVRLYGVREVIELNFHVSVLAVVAEVADDLSIARSGCIRG
jgi:hypothetical protein